MSKEIKDKDIQEIIQDIRDLRDADFHVCPYDEWQAAGEPDTTENISCTCEQFDRVIDKLTAFLDSDA